MINDNRVIHGRSNDSKNKISTCTDLNLHMVEILCGEPVYNEPIFLLAWIIFLQRQEKRHLQILPPQNNHNIIY